MADQAVAKSGAVNGPAERSTWLASRVLGRAARGWGARRCWARYLLYGRCQGVPGLVEFVVANKFFQAIQVPGELVALGEILAALRPGRALEIGTASGGTLFLLTRLANPKATIVSIDLPGGRFGGGYGKNRTWFYNHFARRQQRLHLLRGDSHSDETLDRVKAALDGQPLDYLFIDGDHSYEGVRRDFEMYAPLVRPGGVIAFHDVAEHPPAKACEVSRLWNEIKASYWHAEFIENPRQGWAGIGVLYVD